MGMLFMTWLKLIERCPLELEISHLTDEDYVDGVGAYGTPCKKPKHKWTKGTLTVKEVSDGWIFSHPGFIGGEKHLHAFNGDTSVFGAQLFMRWPENS